MESKDYFHEDITGAMKHIKREVDVMKKIVGNDESEEDEEHVFLGTSEVDDCTLTEFEVCVPTRSAGPMKKIKG